MDDLTAPATKADIHRLEQGIDKLEQRIDKLDQRFDEFERAIERRFASVEEKLQGLWTDIDRVLALLTNIEDRLKKPIDDHERRIKHLERTVGIRN